MAKKTKNLFSRQVIFGGEITSYGKMISELQRTLPSQKAVDRYLQGYNLNEKRRKKCK